MSEIERVFCSLNRRVGCKGVSLNKRSNKYRIANGKVLSLGQYEDAHDAYLAPIVVLLRDCMGHSFTHEEKPKL